jgi:hypothetical protein
MSKTLSEMKKKKEMLESKVRKLREEARYRASMAFLIENELEKAEIVLAAKAIVDKLSKMAEDLATVEGEDIMPMMDQLRQAYGDHLADDFYEISTTKLRDAIECLVASKDALSHSVEKLEGVLNGEPVANDMMMDEPENDFEEPAHHDEEPEASHEEEEHDEETHDDPTPAVPFSGRERKPSAESVLSKGSLVETLKTSKNSDRVIAEAFMSQIKNGVSVAEAVKAVAEAADIQIADVVEIAKEAVAENVSISPVDQAKDAAAAAKIAKQLKSKTQSSDSVAAAVASSAPKMGVKNDQLTHVGDMVKAELKGANRMMKENDKASIGAFQIKKRDITGLEAKKPALMAKQVTEELVGHQSEIDANHNGKIDAEDFKMLRKKKKVKEDKDQDDKFTRWMNQAKTYSLRTYGEDIRSDHWDKFRPAFEEGADFEDAVDNRFNVDGIEPDFDKWCASATYNAKHEFDMEAPKDTKDCKADFEDGFSPKDVAEKWHEKFGA